MKKDLTRTIEIPEGVQAEIKEYTVTVKADGKEISKIFRPGRVTLKVEGNQFKLNAQNATRRESKMMGTINAHIKNMIKGVREEFIYKMEVCNVHFPMNVKADNNTVTIKSFLGQKTDRKAKILPETKVEIKRSKITITSPSIENAGQTAANIEKASRLTGKDRRIFQDGIFITEKNGRKI